MDDQLNAGQKKVVWSRLPITFITALFCCVLWGSASPAIKIAYEIFEIPADDTAAGIMIVNVAPKKSDPNVTDG